MRTLLAILVIASTSLAMPPAAPPIRPADRQRLEASATQLAKRIAELRTKLQDKPQLLALLPDVEIYHKAIDWPLRYGELLDVKKADAAIAAANQRIDQLAAGQAPWVAAGGVRAYVSKIDGSIQPYQLFTPANFKAEDKAPRRLDIFFHGRNEKLMELEFISNKPPDSPLLPTDENRFVVFPYGRYCCANKFAGEIDTLELLDAIKKQYPIDDRRIVVAGFSMGGAACWHHAVHYTDLFCAASPGAGFVDTRYYQKMDESGDWAALPDWRKKLMRLYDCPDWALNLSMLPTISYAGDLDKQKAAGDVMEKSMADLGLKLQRIGAPNTPHKYSPEAKQQIANLLDQYAEKGKDPLPKEVRFVTYTLRYNRMHWITITSLEKHWEQARIEAKVTGPDSIEITTRNIAKFEIAPAILGKQGSTVTLDGSKFQVTPRSDPYFIKGEKEWILPTPRAEILGDRGDFPGFPRITYKRHGLQGPIDDAFLDAFVIVRPTGKPMNEKVGQWCAHELEYATAEWRKIFRGEARVIDDSKLIEDQIATRNLVLFGDPSSNAVLAKIADKLPIRWDATGIQLGGKKFPADQHALVLICPNPLNSKRYVVINSGFTFRQNDHKSNAWQIAKLPDYAVIGLSQAPDDSAPGKIAEAGFFDEYWQLPQSPARGDRR